MKTKIFLLLLLSLSSSYAKPGGWFFDLIKDTGHCGDRYHNNNHYDGGYYYRQQPVVEYTPWERYYGQCPEYLYNNPRIVIRNYGNYYDICWKIYRY